MNKKLSCFSYIFLGLSLVTSLFLSSNESLLRTESSYDHNSSCTWHHYERVEPTYENRGSQEYYVCCKHHESVLDRPEVGTIIDKGSQTLSFINSLDDTDFRLIPSYREQVKPIQDEIDLIPELYEATDGSTILKAYRDYQNTSDALKTYLNDVDKLLSAYESYNERYQVLIDVTQNEYECRIYNSDYDLTLGYDENYGYYSSFTNVVMRDDCWFGLGRNVLTSTSKLDEVFLYVYNNMDFAIDVEVRDVYDFDLYGSRTKIQPQNWGKVNVDMGVFVNHKLADLFIGSYISGKTDVLMTNGFKYTSLYGAINNVYSKEYIKLDNDVQFNSNVSVKGEGKLIEEIDYFARIISTSYSEFAGKVNFITNQAYSGVTSIEFDYKIDGTATGWWGLGHNSTVEGASIYTGMMTTGITTSGNEWKHYTRSVSIAGPEYIYIIIEKNTFLKDVYIDNFVINCGNVSYRDDFNTGESALFNNNPSVTAGAVKYEAKKAPAYYLSHTQNDYALRIDTASYGGAAANYKATFTSKEEFENVVSISYDTKIEGEMTREHLGETEALWWGFGVTDDSYGIYHTEFAKGDIMSTNNEWTNRSVGNGTPQSGYLVFVINPDKTNCPIYIDNIVITTSSGYVYTDGFTNGESNLFNVGYFCSIETRSTSSVSFDGGTGPDNYSVLIDMFNYGNRNGNEATLITKNKLNNVTKVSFDLMIEGEVTYSNPSDYWIGFGHNSTGGAHSLYEGLNIRNLTNTNNTWQHFDLNFNDISGDYFYFVSNPGHGKNNLYLDNVVIVTGEGTLTDNFSKGRSDLFNLGQDTSMYYNGFNSVNDFDDIYDSLVNASTYFEGPEFEKDNLSGRDSLVHGSISHQIIGEARYAILIFNDESHVEYLLVDDSSISLYRDYSVISSLDILSNTYSLVITNNGMISINDTYIGQTSGVNKAIRFSSLFNEGKIIFSDISLYTSFYHSNDTETIDGIVVPNFASNTNVSFAAYGSPTVANWTGGENNPSFFDDEHISDFKEAGFNKFIPLYEGRTGARYDFNTIYDQYLEATDPSVKANLKQQLIAKLDLICAKAEQDAMEALYYADKYDLQYVVLNAIVFEIIHQKTPNGNEIHVEDYEWIFDRVFQDKYEYFEQVAFYGHFVQDEPIDVEGLTRLLAALTLYYVYAEKLGVQCEPVVNLLPGGYNSTYIAYLDYYFDNIAKMVGYVSFDQYVLDYSNGSYKIRDEHLANLEMMAVRIKQGGNKVQLRTYIFPRAEAEGSHRAITLANELRFQIYANLVYGTTEIIYYGYVVHNSEKATLGLVNMYTGEKSQVYYFAKEVNNEILTFGQYYRHFYWDGTIAKYKSYLSRPTQFKKLQNSISSHKGISSFSVGKDTLIGCFVDEQGQDAYVLMYYADPKVKTDTDTVELKFNNYNAIIVFQNGTKHVYRMTNHTYSLTMSPGCGAFVIPITLD